MSALKNEEIDGCANHIKRSKFLKAKRVISVNQQNMIQKEYETKL